MAISQARLDWKGGFRQYVICLAICMLPGPVCSGTPVFGSKSIGPIWSLSLSITNDDGNTLPLACVVM